MRSLKAYLAVVLWMIAIFLGSTDIASARNTSRFIGPLLHWFKPDISDSTIRAVQALVRKSGHVTEYAVLAALCWRSQRQLRATPGEWRWSEFRGIVAFCMLYAITDELHQLFVSSRQSSPYDVMFDTAGAALGLLIIRLCVSRKRSVVAIPGE